MELSNCNAVITGGASGLGGATADIIINNGGRVTIIDIQNNPNNNATFVTEL